MSVLHSFRFPSRRCLSASIRPWVFQSVRSLSSNASSTPAPPSASASASAIRRVGVVGAGQMGTGIALVAAMVSKLPVTLVDSKEEAVKNAVKFANSLVEKDLAKGKLSSDDAKAAIARISTSTSLEQLAHADIVIEAVSENLDLKRSIFSKLSQITAPSAILASNTSSISITKLAAATSRPSQVIGMHFMNPVPVMKLVEVIEGLQTSDATLQTTFALAAAMGKTTTKARDIPGFIANRILMPYINEAVYALYEGIGSREDIDNTMKLGTGVPMGPLTLADFIGLDTCLSILKVLHEGLGDTKYRACPLLQSYVDAGWLGKKVGRGFYEYSSNSTMAKAK